MRQIDPDDIPHSEAHRYLLAGVAPRPIAFVGTLDEQGRPNLSPFSFFNAFGVNPPVVAFSPAFRGSDGTPKHTFLNIKATGEFTVSVVSYSMVEQVSLASSDFPEGVDEFVKAGFTKLPSVKIRPFGVAESPMVLECRLLHHIDFGRGPGSANLLIGEVVMFHIKDSVFDGKYLNAERLDLVARMGGPLYCRASGPAVFTLDKPTHVGIGFDRLPEDVRTSTVLTGNDLGKLAGVKALPEPEAVESFWRERAEQGSGHASDDLAVELRVCAPERALDVVIARLRAGAAIEDQREDLHRIGQIYLRKGMPEDAWKTLLGPVSLAQS
jgi:flavin reductase (DIM6/NTAB) family NADH-FMN oxidoreductase RutF